MAYQVTFTLNSAYTGTTQADDFTIVAKHSNGSPADDTLATGVTKANLIAGVTYTVADTVTGGTVTSTGVCTNSVSWQGLGAAPPTETPTPTPTTTLEPPNFFSVDANPSQIFSGDSSLLTWTTTNATGVTINNGVGTFGPNTSTSVNPTTTTTYTLTATGPGGTDTSIITITVIQPTPTPTPEDVTPTPTPTLYSYYITQFLIDNSDFCTTNYVTSTLIQSESATITGMINTIIYDSNGDPFVPSPADGWAYISLIPGDSSNDINNDPRYAIQVSTLAQVDSVSTICAGSGGEL